MQTINTTTAGAPTRGAASVFICEDDRALRDEFEALLRLSDRYEVVGVSAYGRDAMAMLDAVKIDVLLLDLQLPDCHGFDVLAHKRRVQPACEALIVTVFADEANVLGAIQAGATGYVLKDETTARLLALMDELLAGGSPITPSVARRLLTRLHTPSNETAVGVPASRSAWCDTLPSALPFNWTEREDQVLSTVAKGYSIQEVADLLQLSANTVKTHVRRIYDKLAVSSRSEALHEARALGLLDRGASAVVRDRARS